MYQHHRTIRRRARLANTNLCRICIWERTAVAAAAAAAIIIIIMHSRSHSHGTANKNACADPADPTLRKFAHARNSSRRALVAAAAAAHATHQHARECGVMLFVTRLLAVVAVRVRVRVRGEVIR